MDPDKSTFKIEVNYKNEKRNYVLRYKHASLDGFKRQIFERVPEIEHKKIKIYWTDFDNDNIYIVTEEDFKFSVENDVRKYFVVVKENDVKISSSNSDRAAIVEPAIPVNPPINSHQTQSQQQQSRDTGSGAHNQGWNWYNSNTNSNRNNNNSSTRNSTYAQASAFAGSTIPPWNSQFRNFTRTNNDTSRNFDWTNTINNRNFNWSNNSNGFPGASQFFSGPGGSFFRTVNGNGQASAFYSGPNGSGFSSQNFNSNFP